jgi:hypothetical protein
VLDATAGTGISLQSLLNNIGQIGTEQTASGPNLITQ